MSNNYLTIKLDKKALVSATTGQSDPNTTNTSNTWDIFFALALKAISSTLIAKKGQFLSNRKLPKINWVFIYSPNLKKSSVQFTNLVDP